VGQQAERKFSSPQTILQFPLRLLKNPFFKNQDEAASLKIGGGRV